MEQCIGSNWVTSWPPFEIKKWKSDLRHLDFRDEFIYDFFETKEGFRYTGYFNAVQKASECPHVKARMEGLSTELEGWGYTAHLVQTILRQGTRELLWWTLHSHMEHVVYVAPAVGVTEVEVTAFFEMCLLADMEAAGIDHSFYIVRAASDSDADPKLSLTTAQQAIVALEAPSMFTSPDTIGGKAMKNMKVRELVEALATKIRNIQEGSVFSSTWNRIP